MLKGSTYTTLRLWIASARQLVKTVGNIAGLPTGQGLYADTWVKSADLYPFFALPSHRQIGVVSGTNTSVICEFSPLSTWLTKKTTKYIN